MADFYIYVYIDPRTDEPRYVGKGSGNRDTDHFIEAKQSRRKTYFYNWLRKCFSEGVQRRVKRLLVGLIEQDAFFFETFFIRLLGRKDKGLGLLCNLTDGGEGMSGHINSFETLIKKSEAGRRRYEDPEELALKSEITTSTWKDPDVRARRCVGIKHALQNPEVRAKYSEAAKRVCQDPEVLARKSEAAKACMSRPGMKAKQSDTGIRTWQDADIRAKRTKGHRKSPPKQGRRFKGVYPSHRGGKWFVRFMRIHIGTFNTELEAAQAYNNAVDVHWSGEGWKNRVINIPVELERRQQTK